MLASAALRAEHAGDCPSDLPPVIVRGGMDQARREAMQ